MRSVESESLERRALLTAELNGSVLLVEGTDEADTILITQSMSQVMVQENGGEAQGFPVGQVALIRVLGHGGDDTIDSRDVPIRARVDGGEGDDFIRAGNATNDLRGNGGDDTLIGFDGADSLIGGGGDDLIRGQRGPDNIRGGNGNDRLFGAGDLDVIRGGSGNDYIEGAGDNDTLLGENGKDTIFGSAGMDSMRGGNGADEVHGGAGNDTVRGGAGADILTGGSGSDLMLASGGNDSLRGGTGRDVMVGGEGRDTMFGGADGDLMVAARRDIPDKQVNGNTLNLPPDQKMVFIADEWRSDRSYDQRVINIRDGAGKSDDRLNDEYYLIGRNRNEFPTVFNDFGFVDQLMGQQGQDYFFLSEDLGDDDITDMTAEERREKI